MLPDSSKGHSFLQIVGQRSWKVEKPRPQPAPSGSAIRPDYSTLGPSVEGRGNSLGDKAFF
jgi:hypothetical protein